MSYNQKTDDIVSAMRSIKHKANSVSLKELKDALNSFYRDSSCKGILFTNNADKMFFGMCVLPVITDKTAVKILQSDDAIRLSEYYVEIDSKLLNPVMGITAEELTAIILHEVGHVVNDATPVETLRKQVDLYLIRNGETISITDSIYYRNILAFGFSDAIRKITSVFFDYEEVDADEYVIKNGFGEQLTSAMDKILKNGYTINKDVNNKFVILTWVLRLYKNVKFRRIAALRSIRRSKSLTPSQLEKKQLDSLDDGLRRIDDSSLIEAVVLEFTKPNEKFREFKIKGLKGFDADYYEYKMITRNIADQDQAIYIVRQINTRLSVIDNFLETEKLTDSEKDRWQKLFDKYSELRDDLSSKITYKDRFVGLQVNYPSIKGLDY